MNKLYAINWTLPNGYILSVSYYWTETAAKEKIGKNSEWTFTVQEDNEVHKIWIAR